MTSILRSVVRVAELMATFRPCWAVMRRMGRGRVDGRADNDHVDIDIATFTDDQGAVFEQVFEQLSGWT